MNDFEKGILSKTIEKYGIKHQLVKLMEECGELVQAAGKCFDVNESMDEVNFDHHAEEMADVEILIDQFKLMFPDKIDFSVNSWRKKKLNRLSE